MKKITLVLGAISPLVKGWSVAGFIEPVGEPKEDVEPQALKETDLGCIIGAEETPLCLGLVLPYEDLPLYLADLFKILGSDKVSIRPLDRPGLLIQFEADLDLLVEKLIEK